SREMLGHKNVATTTNYTHVLNRPGLHIRSPLIGRRLLITCDRNNVRRKKCSPFITNPRLISLGLWRTLHETSTLYTCPRPYSGFYGRRARAEREGRSPNKCRGGHQETG